MDVVEFYQKTKRGTNNNMEQGNKNSNNQPTQTDISQNQLIHKRVNISKNLIIFAFFCITIIASGTIGYFLGLNSQINTKEDEKITELTSQTRLTVTPEPSPASENIKIIDGSVYQISDAGEKHLIIDKEEFRKNTARYYNQLNNQPDQKDPFFNFSQVQLSPDKTKLLLLAQGGLSLEYIYYSSLGGDNLIGLGLTTEACWSNNSRYIAFASKPADAGPNMILYIYDTQLNEITDISRNYDLGDLEPDLMDFSELQWLENDKGIKVKYVAFKGEIPFAEKIGEGETIIKFKQ